MFISINEIREHQTYLYELHDSKYGKVKFSPNCTSYYLDIIIDFYSDKNENVAKQIILYYEFVIRLNRFSYETAIQNAGYFAYIFSSKKAGNCGPCILNFFEKRKFTGWRLPQ